MYARTNIFYILNSRKRDYFIYKINLIFKSQYVMSSMIFEGEIATIENLNKFDNMNILVRNLSICQDLNNWLNIR